MAHVDKMLWPCDVLVVGLEATPVVAHRSSFSPMADSSESTRGVQRREGMQAGLVGNVEENEDEDEDEDENAMKVICSR